MPTTHVVVQGSYENEAARIVRAITKAIEGAIRITPLWQDTLQITPIRQWIEKDPGNNKVELVVCSLSEYQIHWRIRKNPSFLIRFNTSDLVDFEDPSSSVTPVDISGLLVESETIQVAVACVSAHITQQLLPEPRVFGPG